MVPRETVIRRCSVAELEAAPNLYELVSEYAAESHIPEMGSPKPQFDMYRLLEAGGHFHPIGAFDGDRLVGFILPIVITLPHYGAIAATGESFFVPAAERKRGIGLKLLAFAEALAKSLGAKALLLSAPTGGSLCRVLPRKGYRHSNDVFVKALA